MRAGTRAATVRTSRRARRARAAGVAAVLAALTAARAGPAFALPDGTPWGRADGEACRDCHFVEAVVEPSSALELEGLPERFMTGETYRLVLELEAPDMGRAGFRIIASAPEGASPGRFAPVDAETEADGDRIRSTRAGSELDAAGRARWTFEWHAPPDGTAAAAVELDVSANAANDDDSPFGDTIHRLERRSAPIGPAGGRDGRDRSQCTSECRE